MKYEPIEILSNRKSCGLTRRISGLVIAAAQAVLFCTGAMIAAGQADSAVDDEGAQVLTRGPVHEAFAGIVSYNPEPGPVVGKAPPEAIEEVPPEIRPAGDNISWIPGYWGWDDERSDYLWISGTWRALPPGRQWTSGYWGTSGQGYQWTSGYWADSTVQETVYLPKPPVTVEAGPNIEAPSRDHAWTPGSWMWNQERYAWRPGYWAEGRSDWDWIPAHYVWTPRGYVFVNGYWDYSFDRRGVLYAPVHFQPGYYSRPGYSYSPVVAIGLVALMEHLFLRPNYHHYYFGDYYDRGYRARGYYSPYAYQSSHHGYDPVYSYRRWTHRRDRDWERRHEASYDYRRDHESARPPRTWADQQRVRLDNSEAREQRLLLAAPFDQMSKQPDHPVRTERVREEERRNLTDMSRAVRKAREQRRALETDGVPSGHEKAARDIKPTKVRLPASPIIGKSPDRFDPSQAPPKPQRPPTGDPGKTKQERRPEAEKNRPEPGIHPGGKHEPRPEPRTREPKRIPAKEPKLKEAEREAREKSRQPERTSPAKAREPGKRDEEPKKPSSVKNPGSDKESSEQPGGKNRKGNIDEDGNP